MGLVNFEEAFQEHQAGRLSQAAVCYEKILQHQPRHADALHLLGVLHHQSGRNDMAIRLIKAAIAEKKSPLYSLNLASVLRSNKAPIEARHELEQALLLFPDAIELSLALSAVLLDLGCSAESIQHGLKVLKHRPENGDAWFQVGSCYALLGQYQEAVQALERARVHTPGNMECLMRLAHAYLSINKLDEASVCFVRVGAAYPDDRRRRKHFYNLLNRRRPVTILPALVNDLRDYALAADTSIESISYIARGVMLSDDALHGMLSACRAARSLSIDTNILLAVPLTDGLFHKLLVDSMLTDPLLELVLVNIRRLLLATVCQPQPLSAGIDYVPLLCSLAIQCHNNEYVYFISDEEKIRCQELASSIMSRLSSAAALSFDTQLLIATLALYQPLTEFAGFARLPASSDPVWDPKFRALIRRHVDNCRAEQQLVEELPCAYPLHELSSEAFAEYQANPYPRWVEIDRPAAESLDSAFKAFGLSPAVLQTPEYRKILVAGCGTGREAIALAMRYPDAQVVAIDYSPRSLAYGVRKSREMNVSNVDFLLGDILSLDQHAERYGVIVCTGVLHHIQDPAYALGILARLLAPSGMLSFGVYSEFGRDPLRLTREQFSQQLAGQTPDNIRRARRDIIDRLLFGQPDNNVRHSASMRDFYSLSQSRFILLDTVEHLFTLPAIKNLLDTQALRFCGFSDLDGGALARYRSEYPDDVSHTNLDNWHAFEQKNTAIFQGMYKIICSNG